MPRLRCLLILLRRVSFRNLKIPGGYREGLITMVIRWWSLARSAFVANICSAELWVAGQISAYSLLPLERNCVNQDVARAPADAMQKMLPKWSHVMPGRCYIFSGGIRHDELYFSLVPKRSILGSVAPGRRRRRFETLVGKCFSDETRSLSLKEPPNGMSLRREMEVAHLFRLLERLAAGLNQPPACVGRLLTKRSHLKCVGGAVYQRWYVIPPGQQLTFP